MKRIISLMVILTMLLPCIPTVSFGAENTTDSEKVIFEDIVGHWAREDIEYLYRIGIVNGVSENKFSPDTYITRAELVAMLARGLNLKEDIYAVNYSDVSVIDDWFAGELGAAINAGIIEDSLHAFLPCEYLTREETAQIAAQTATVLNYTSGVEKENTFTDVIALSSESQESIQLLNEANVMNGTSETTFEPYNNLTRAESVGVVKRLMLLSESVQSVGADMTDIAENSGFEDKGDSYGTETEYAYLRFDNIELSQNINSFEAEVSAIGENLTLEIWSNSLDPLAGTLLGTMKLEPTANIGTFTTQKTLINKTYGNHSIYLRFVGNGEIRIKDFAFKDDTFSVDVLDYSEIDRLKKNGNSITNLVYGGYVQYNNVFFGAGYDTIELDIENAQIGDLIEVWLEDAVTDSNGKPMDLRAGIIGVEKDRHGKIVARASVVKCRDTQNVILKPLTNISGSIMGIRFTNSPPAAEIHLESEDAVSTAEFEQSTDFNETEQTVALMNGDTLKFEQVQLGDGYNFIDVRIKNNPIDKYMLALANEAGSATTGIMGINVDEALLENRAYLEVRLDSENGPVIGKVRQNPVSGVGEYDIQSGELTGAFGIHDLYIKAVGDIGWNINWIKLKCQGYYDMPMVAIEAEDCLRTNGVITSPLDADRFKNNTPEQESSGRRNVKLTDKDSYIDFVVPEWFEGGENIAINVRHSIPDAFDENNFSVGQKGEMAVYVNGEKRKLIMPYDSSDVRDMLGLTSEYMYGYRSAPGAPGLGHIKDVLCSEYFDETSAVIEGTVNSGDIITLKPVIDDRINLCYVDFIELEKIGEKRNQPENFLSITEMGAVSNDGADDAVALRAAIDEVKANPDKWAGVWIPEGYWEMKSFLANPGGQKSAVAYVDDVRILGAGMWHSRVQVDNCDTTINNNSLIGGKNTMLWDFAYLGSSKTRDWGYGCSTIALGSDWIKYGFNAKNIWMEHWNAGIWGMHIIGVMSHMKIKNCWADGINVLAKLGVQTDGAIVEHSLIRSTADDAIAAFSPCPPVASPYVNNVEYYKIRFNSIAHTYWGSSISLWGTEHSVIENNYVKDPGFMSGMAIQSTVGVNATRLLDDVLIKGNRFVRCGGGGNNHDNGAISFTSSWQSDDYNTKVINTGIQKNDFIDNLHEVIYVYAGTQTDEIAPDVSYNYIRNIGLAAPGNETLTKYDNAALMNITFRYNVLESSVNQYLSANKAEINDSYIGNYPYNWGN